MTLASSGSISIGGTTANRSINLELGRSATATSSLGESTLRALANDTSGAISMSTFRGKSNNLDSQTVTIGSYTVSFYGNSIAYYGLYNSGSFVRGSVSDGTSNMFGGNTIYWLNYASLSGAQYVYFAVIGNHSNSGFTSMTIAGGSTLARTAATHSYISNGNYTRWAWSVSSNQFGTSGTKVITWS